MEGRYRQFAGCDTLKASAKLSMLRDAGLLEMKGRGKATYYVPGDRFPITKLEITALLSLPFIALSAHAEGGYTNHAGNVVAGWPVKLTATQVTLAERAAPTARWGHRARPTADHLPTATYPLSIFPESEQRRIAADFGQPRVPVAVRRAIAGAEKAMARSRKRAEKGLCTKEESDAFCAKSAAALKSYLDKQVKEGVITPAERKALGYAY